MCRRQLLRGPRLASFGSRVGFTLVEVVTALALSVLLMAAIMGVLRGVSIQLRMVEKTTEQNWKRLTQELIQNDLLLASRISQSDGWIWLDGAFPRFQVDEEPVSRVGYNCTDWLEGEGALVRKADRTTELVAIGPRRIVIERLDAKGVPQPLSAIPTAVPNRVRMWIWENVEMQSSLVCDLALS